MDKSPSFSATMVGMSVDVKMKPHPPTLNYSVLFPILSCHMLCDVDMFLIACSGKPPGIQETRITDEGFYARRSADITN